MPHYRTPDPIPGTRFGRLVVLGPSEKVRKVWSVPCRCDCGTERLAGISHLRTGMVRSCGCLQRDTTTARNTRHGDAARGSKTPVYLIWIGMRSRCANPREPAFKNYGGRGITVCAEWDDFPAFQTWALANGYAEGLDIDRADNDGPYAPWNCRFVTRRQNMRNMRRNLMLTAFGETKCARAWAEDPRCTVSYPGLVNRVRRSKWDHEKAITAPKFTR